jgi:hypothetical protein
MPWRTPERIRLTGRPLLFKTNEGNTICRPSPLKPHFCIFDGCENSESQERPQQRIFLKAQPDFFIRFASS